MVEGGVRGESGNAADLRVVLLEHERLVTVHPGEVRPAVPRRVRDEIDLALAVAVAYFAGHQVHHGQRPGIADRERCVQHGPLDGTPDIDDGKSLDVRCCGGAEHPP